ncbi:MAG: hypothetical protein M1834_003334 [Cirrosporium novae-zelandiae]|nr:MAG: hypothetical protein M1834_003334 [Cirrosporium novae-zelandiae]
MKRVFRHAALAQRQAKRVEAKFARENRLAEKWQNIAVRKNQVRLANDEIKEARKAWREDWFMGPLAPRRDVGENKDTYGATASERLQSLKVPEAKRQKFINIVPGDRVVITVKRHRDYGKIGVVLSVEEEAETVTVQGLNRMDVSTPLWLLETDPEHQKLVTTVELPFPLSDVLLIAKLRDPQTGIPVDVVVNEMRVRDKFAESDYGSAAPHWTRWIKGLDIQIPWPKMKNEDQSEYPADTLRIDVEEKTWLPSILHPPAPRTVIDELRNKNSKFRDRWSEGFIQWMENKEAMRKQKKAKGHFHMIADERTLTPKQQLKRATDEMRAQAPPPELTEDMLAKIGEVMVASRQQQGSTQAPGP